jgi:hypothetical protein
LANSITGEEHLGKRLDARYYEVFRRGKINANKEAATTLHDSQGEPEKKRPRGGRPKALAEVDVFKLDPTLTQLEHVEMAQLLSTAESLTEANLLSVLAFERAGALVQHEIYNQSFSSAKASYPFFFKSPCYLRALFSSICVDKDIFSEVEKSFSDEMKILDEFLFTTVTSEEYQPIAEARAQSGEGGSKAAFYFALLRSLSGHWEEVFEKVFFEVEVDMCRDVPEPHLVIPDKDLSNICLYVDRTLIFGQLSLSTAIPCLIAVSYMGNMCYNEEVSSLMAYLQQELCDLGRQENRRGEAKKMKKLKNFQAKKSKIIIRQSRGATRLPSAQ